MENETAIDGVRPAHGGEKRTRATAEACGTYDRAQLLMEGYREHNREHSVP